MGPLAHGGAPSRRAARPEIYLLVWSLWNLNNNFSDFPSERITKQKEIALLAYGRRKLFCIDSVYSISETVGGKYHHRFISETVGGNYHYLHRFSVQHTPCIPVSDTKGYRISYAEYVPPTVSQHSISQLVYQYIAVIMLRQYSMLQCSIVYYMQYSMSQYSIVQHKPARACSIVCSSNVGDQGPAYTSNN